MSTPKAGTVSIFRDYSEIQGTPTLSVSAHNGYKILSVGMNVARIDSFNSNFATKCAPTSQDQPNKWSLESKYSRFPVNAMITASSLQIYDPSNFFEIEVWVNTSLPDQPSPTASVQIDTSNYTLIGGGVCANYSNYGQFLIESMPTSDGSGTPNGWSGASKDHMDSDPGSITVYAIGIKSSNGVNGVFSSKIYPSNGSTSSNWPTAYVDLAENDVENGYILCGGGFSYGNQSAGNLATYFCPDPFTPNRWIVAGHDGSTPDKESITGYAIGLQLLPQS